jgi:hypothetical protein
MLDNLYNGETLSILSELDVAFEMDEVEILEEDPWDDNDSDSDVDVGSGGSDRSDSEDGIRWIRITSYYILFTACEEQILKIFAKSKSQRRDSVKMLSFHPAVT